MTLRRHRLFPFSTSRLRNLFLLSFFNNTNFIVGVAAVFQQTRFQYEKIMNKDFHFILDNIRKIRFIFMILVS